MKRTNRKKPAKEWVVVEWDFPRRLDLPPVKTGKPHTIKTTDPIKYLMDQGCVPLI